jgi:CheY-like chemotaxis protein
MTRPPSCAGLRVLVVDDHEDTRELARMILITAGAVVEVAASAREALPHVNDVDIVVTDYSMPRETGAWLLERIREQPRPVPVIVLTAHAEDSGTELGTAGFTRVLRKPIDPWHLCRVVSNVGGTSPGSRPST